MCRNNGWELLLSWSPFAIAPGCVLIICFQTILIALSSCPEIFTSAAAFHINTKTILLKGKFSHATLGKMLFMERQIEQGCGYTTHTMH